MKSNKKQSISLAMLKDAVKVEELIFVYEKLINSENYGTII